MQEVWKDLESRKGERGLQALKNALRNKVVAKDTTYEMAMKNFLQFKSEDIVMFTKKTTVGKKEKGVTWSVVQRMFMYKQNKIDEAIQAGHLWAEDDLEGEEYWYEKTKVRAATEDTTHTKRFKTMDDHETLDSWADMMQNCAFQNQSWLRSALGHAATLKKKGAHSSSSKNNDLPVFDGLMQTLQDAWDASTLLTADAGLLAQKVCRNQTNRR